MTVEDLVEVVMEMFEILRESVDDVVEGESEIAVNLGKYIVTKKFKKGRVEFKLIDGNDGSLLGYIETDGKVYYNVIGVMNWECFIAYLEGVE